MDADKAVTVIFNKDTGHSVRIDLPTIVYFPAILDAYLAATSPTVIRAWGTDFSGNLNLNQNKAITLKGGYNGTYATQPGATTIHGTVTISRGSLTVENVQIE